MVKNQVIAEIGEKQMDPVRPLLDYYVYFNIQKDRNVLLGFIYPKGDLTGWMY